MLIRIIFVSPHDPAPRPPSSPRAGLDTRKGTQEEGCLLGRLGASLLGLNTGLDHLQVQQCLPFGFGGENDSVIIYSVNALVNARSVKPGRDFFVIRSCKRCSRLL